jgi:thymidylate synthase
MNNLDRQYLELVNHILRFGNTKSDRTGTGTKSIFGWQIRHSMKEGFPLLTTKKMAFKTMVTELLWFLRGDTSIEYLLENDCNIWTGDCYRAYLEECKRLEEKDKENK